MPTSRKNENAAVEPHDANDERSLQPAPGRKAVKKEKPEMVAEIGRQLRTVYDDVLAQPVPDRFLALLRELDAPSSKKDSK